MSTWNASDWLALEQVVTMVSLAINVAMILLNAHTMRRLRRTNEMIAESRRRFG